jgi:hypothetical protein
MLGAVGMVAQAVNNANADAAIALRLEMIFRMKFSLP